MKGGRYSVTRRVIHDELDIENKDKHNENFKELYRLKEVINDLVLDSGESNAEVVQARGGKKVLADRLDEMESNTSDVSGEVSSLEGRLNTKLDTKASLDDLDTYAQETEDSLESKLKEVETIIDDTIGNVDFKGAMVSLTKDQTIKSSTWTTVAFDKSDYNLSGFWSSGSKTRLVVPDGVKKVKIYCNTLWDSNSDGTRRVRALKNGNYAKGLFYINQLAGGTSPVGASSGVIEVTKGDYFELEVYQSSGEDRTLREDPYTWFSIEVVDYGKK